MYVTAALLKTYLGISDSTDDTLLTALIARAQAIIDGYTQRTFEASSNATRYFDAVRDVNGQTLYLDTDLCSINSVTNGNGATIAAASYVTEPRNSTPYYAIKLKYDTVWTWEDDPENAIAVNGKWAYSTAAPDGIVQATIELATIYYKMRDMSGDLNRTIVTGTATILPAGLSAQTLSYLKSMRKVHN